MEQIDIVIVDDHAMVAEGMAAMLNLDEHIRVVGIAHSATEAKQLIPALLPDVVLMDFHLRDADGADTARDLLKRLCSLAIIMISGDANAAMLAQAIDAGCVGFLKKDLSSEELALSVHAVARGESFIAASELSDLLQYLKAPNVVAPKRLTSRETQILAYLAEGQSADRISQQLYISVHTVRNHCRRIFQKLGVHSQLEAVAVATRDGLITSA